MYRDRLENTETSSLSAQKLKQVMIAYHDFQNFSEPKISRQELAQLTEWQSQRLKQTHHDLYQAREYAEGLSFLLSQLYSSEDFSARDRDLERIFPKLVKWLPDSVIDTVSILVELNLLTQNLDQQLAEQLYNEMALENLTEQDYCTAYRACDNYELRLQQIDLTEQAGYKLNKYARSSIIHYSLKLSRSAAENAGLGALHRFIKSGFDAFHSMKNIEHLMTTLVQRERIILNNIYQGQNEPFNITSQDTSDEHKN